MRSGRTTRDEHRAHAEPGWCPAIERQQVRASVREEAARAERRQTFKQYVADYGAWATVHKRGWRKTERYSAARLEAELGDRLLEAITTADVERVLDRLLGVCRNSAAGRRRAWWPDMRT
jgi:hypothetical protein